MVMHYLNRHKLRVLGLEGGFQGPRKPLPRIPQGLERLPLPSEMLSRYLLNAYPKESLRYRSEWNLFVWGLE